MMKRISKSQQVEIDKAAGECQAAADELEKAIDAFNEAVEPFRERLETAVSDYNEKINDLKSVYTDIAQEAADYQSERSEKWQEGEVGQAYQEWVDQLAEPQIEEVELELPEPLQLPDGIPDFGDDSWLPPNEPGDA